MKQEVYFEPNENRDLFLNYCGTEVCAPDFCVRPHIRQEYLIHYILAGTGQYHTPQRSYPLKAGDIFLIYPGQPIHYQTDSWDPFHFSWFGFSGPAADTVVQELGFSQDACVRHLHTRYSIHEPILKCVDLQNSGCPSNSFVSTSMLYDILGRLSLSFQADSAEEVRSRDVVHEHVYRAIAYIKQNYMTPISVTTVVNFIGLDRSYFSKIFQKCTGISVQRYLLETRISQAKLLLEHTTYTVREVCSYVGIQDECYFSRVFKKLEGCSPRSYRMLCQTQNGGLTAETKGDEPHADDPTQ